MSAVRLIVLLAMLMPLPVGAQDNPAALSLDLLSPDPLQGFAPPRAGDLLTLPVPYAPPESGLGRIQPPSTEVILEARLVEGGEPLPQGVIWRVFKLGAAGDAELPLVATAQGGTTSVQLAPGSYVVHSAFGRAGASKRLTVSEEPLVERLVLGAGGLKLDAIAGGSPIAGDKVTFEIFTDDEYGEQAVIVPEAQAGLIVRLAAGTYHVVSRYGEVNAIVRADIRVAAGKLTEVVISHTGAEATLKLVEEDGGEALANTRWSVLTPAGDVVHESVGAFPTIVLAEGAYTAVARHDGQLYSRDFEIEAGFDRDVEVRLADLVRQGPERGAR